MSYLLDADDVLHSALYFVNLVGMAGQSLQSDACGPIMRGTEAAAEEIMKAIDLVEKASRQLAEVERNG